ncbi:ribosomal biogenesis protein LAS1L isoform 2-T2 [Rhinophrynus dorsalis]
MAAGRKQVVAWLSKAEWDQVLEYLYSRDCKLQREALQRISAWKSRYGNSMPLAVDCTADLVRCKILDMNGGMGAEELVLVYGLALVRFVNLITERKQKTVSIPLRRLATELKIPEWVVNLRHDVTHGKLPKLSMCRKGWDFVMEWLRREYWSRQLSNTPAPQWVSEEEEESEETEDIVPTMSLKEKKQQALSGKLRESLRSYASEQLKIFQELHQESKQMKQWNITADLEFIISQIKDLVKQNSSETAVETLLEDGFIIPTRKHLLALKIEQKDMAGSLQVPRMLLRVWQPLLRTLHSHVFTQELLEKMFVELGQCKESNQMIRAHFLSCWISELLVANQRAGEFNRKGSVPSRSQSAVKSKWRLFTHKVNLQWKRLMQKCLESPCRTTPKLLQLIFDYMKPGLTTDAQEKLLYLCSVYIQDDAFDMSIDYSDQPIYTVESLEWKIRQESKSRAYSQWGRSVLEEEEEEEEEQEVSDHTEDEEMATEESYDDDYYQMINIKLATERRAALQGSPWGVSEEFVKWSEYPLGVVPGQTEDPGCLLLDSYSEMAVLDQQITKAAQNGSSASNSV